MPINFQVIDGPAKLNLPGSSPYDSGIVFPGSTPSAPFDANKREYWAIKTGQQAVFNGQTIAEIAAISGVESTSCTDFVKYLRGKNGGPPSYSFDRYMFSNSSVADRPDQFGSSPAIPGWTSTAGFKVTLTGTAQAGHGTVDFQGVILRRWAANGHDAEEYWLLNAPNGRFIPGDTVTFSSQSSSSAIPKELVTNFPDLLPDPDNAGSLSDYCFWYNIVTWDALDGNPSNWQTQICG